MARPIHVLQPAFTGGEISDDVASRVDLEKYQLALLNAENAVIRPYGAVKKRTGTAYIGSTKNNAKAVLRRFEFGSELSYLLEFGVGYLRIWRQAAYLNVELSTPFTESDLSKIRTVQSVDVMYICTGTHPVKKLTRFAENNWTLEDVDWTLAPFEDEQPNKNIRVKPFGEDGEIQIDSDSNIFRSTNVGDYIKIVQKINGRAASYSHATENTSHTTAAFSMPTHAKSNSKLVVSWNVAKTGSSAATVRIDAKYTDETMTQYNTNHTGVGYPKWITTKSSSKTVWKTVSTKAGTSDTWTASGTYNLQNEYETNYSNGSSYQTVHSVTYAGQMRLVITNIDTNPMNLVVTNHAGKKFKFTGIQNDKAYTAAMKVGEQWKIITHGIWKGTVQLQISYDEGTNWTTIRTYTGNEDFNPTESGTVEEMALVRVYSKITSGSVKIDLSSYPYKNIGYAKITSYVDQNTVMADVIKDFEAGVWSSEWYLSAWGQTNKYPCTATFFQDRLVLGGNQQYPQRIWMSKTGDYENFEVEKVSGTVTDDSAISADLLSQQPFQIQHMLATNDLIIFTEGNSWTISGSEAVTPTNISPNCQESYGANNVRVMRIGNRCVYVQRRGGTVRDTGYAYDVDSYVGQDLTLLAKHLVRGHKLIDGDYSPEPDSTLYFVRDDGVLLCLAYIPDQKVYGWSHFVTDGKYESVCVISEGDEDRAYVIVRRLINNSYVRYIERFALDKFTNRQQEYRNMDCYTVVTADHPVSTIYGLDYLEGKDVVVIANNYYYDDKTYTVTNGSITLPERIENEAVVGLPYTMLLEQPNFDIGNTDTGTVQGRLKNVSAATLRLVRSYGGSIGPNSNAQNKIIIDKEHMALGQNVLFTGDKKVVLGIGGYNQGGRTYIRHEEPFPFNLNAIIREVTLSDV